MGRLQILKDINTSKDELIKLLADYNCNDITTKDFIARLDGITCDLSDLGKAFDHDRLSTAFKGFSTR